MQAVILCGGKGTRLGRVGENIPKPLIPVGGKPVLWHIMKIYSHHGVKDFVLCLGYRGDMIKDYFTQNNNENWNIHFVDTGEASTKSERISQVKDLITEENFFLAYGDDLSDVDIKRLLDFHKKMGKTVTITAVNPVFPFGIVEADKNNVVNRFLEKPKSDKWINGGFMVMNREVFDYLGAGELEKEVFSKLAALGQICAYRHDKEWTTMNTLKDHIELNEMWANGKAFWKVWK